MGRWSREVGCRDIHQVSGLGTGVNRLATAMVWVTTWLLDFRLEFRLASESLWLSKRVGARKGCAMEVTRMVCLRTCFSATAGVEQWNRTDGKKTGRGVILSMKREGALEKLRGFAPDMALSYEITSLVSKPEAHLTQATHSPKNADERHGYLQQLAERWIEQTEQQGCG